MKAQSTLEYILTYGWAFAIVFGIVVVPYILFLIVAFLISPLFGAALTAVGPLYLFIAFLVPWLVFSILFRVSKNPLFKATGMTLGSIFGVLVGGLVSYEAFKFLGLAYYVAVVVVLFIIVAIADAAYKRFEGATLKWAFGLLAMPAFVMFYEIIKALGLWYYLLAALIVAVLSIAWMMLRSKKWTVRVVPTAPPMRSEPVKT